jgi:ABC-type phosphate/phosphonate transport system permease subunit
VDGDGGSVGKRALPTAVVDFPGFSANELGDFAGAVSVDREAVPLYAALLSVDAALYGDAFEAAIHNLVKDLSNVGCSEEEIAYDLSRLPSPEGG